MYIKALPKRIFFNEMGRRNVNDKTVEDFKTTIFISVNDPDSPGTHYFKEEHPNVVTLYFHDCEDDIEFKYVQQGFKRGKNDELEPQYVPIIFFNEEMAKKVLDVLEYGKQNNAASVIVHCTAGISRSGAIATFARDFFNSPSVDDFRTENTYICPNSTVKKFLYKEWEKRTGRIGYERFEE